jgi:hypothetical protein
MGWGGGQPAVGLAGLSPAPFVDGSVVGPATRARLARSVGLLSSQWRWWVSHQAGAAASRGPPRRRRGWPGRCVGRVGRPGWPAEVQPLAGRPSRTGGSSVIGARSRAANGSVSLVSRVADRWSWPGRGRWLLGPAGVRVGRPWLPVGSPRLVGTVGTAGLGRWWLTSTRGTAPSQASRWQPSGSRGPTRPSSPRPRRAGPQAVHGDREVGWMPPVGQPPGRQSPAGQLGQARRAAGRRCGCLARTGRANGSRAAMPVWPASANPRRPHPSQLAASHSPRRHDAAQPGGVRRREQPPAVAAPGPAGLPGGPGGGPLDQDRFGLDGDIGRGAPGCRGPAPRHGLGSFRRRPTPERSPGAAEQARAGPGPRPRRARSQPAVEGRGGSAPAPAASTDGECLEPRAFQPVRQPPQPPDPLGLTPSGRPAGSWPASPGCPTALNPPGELAEYCSSPGSTLSTPTRTQAPIRQCGQVPEAPRPATTTQPQHPRARGLPGNPDSSARRLHGANHPDPRPPPQLPARDPKARPGPGAESGPNRHPPTPLA